MLLSTNLRREYVKLFRTCEIRPEWEAEVHAAANRILRHTNSRYFEVAYETQVPSLVVGILHYLDSECSFEKLLADGEDKGGDHPVKRWQRSAIATLKARALEDVRSWDLPTILHQFERWKGFQYRQAPRPLNAPHLWGGSCHYQKGLVTEGGQFEPELEYRAIGAATLLRFFSEREVFHPFVPVSDQEPAYDPHTSSPEVADLQRALNRFPGVFLAVDGIAGPITSEAYRRLTGSYLAGDPRAQTELAPSRVSERRPQGTRPDR